MLFKRETINMMLSSAVVMVVVETIIHNVAAAPLVARKVIQGGGLLDYLQPDPGSKIRDFTEINKGICPPSLCRNYAHSEGHVKARIAKETSDYTFFQGDIVLDDNLRAKLFPENFKSRYLKTTIRDRDKLWKNGEVKFEMDQKINAKSQQALRNAMRHISNHTCITFKERTSWDRDYVLFTSEPGCWSKVGRTTGMQKVNIGDGCENLGIAAHEIMHALGMWHEQGRQDRDSYIQVLYENIEDDKKDQFEIVNHDLTTSLDYPYDYLSLMHYSALAFSKNGKPTIKVVGVGKRLKFAIGQRLAMVVGKLKEMYGCNIQSPVDRIGAVIHYLGGLLGLWTTKATCHPGNFSDGRDYQGQLDHTLESYTCQKWTDSYPHNHTLAAYSQSTDGLGDHNRCRNPGALRRSQPWCYTIKTSPEWGYCDVRACHKTPSVTAAPAFNWPTSVMFIFAAMFLFLFCSLKLRSRLKLCSIFFYALKKLKNRI